MSGERIVVGLSGGVDSAVAALRLKRAGYDVHGLFMSNWEEDDVFCTAARDYQDARQVCEELSIPLHRVSFAAQYRQRVFDYFLREYQAGRTPNPDVLCNREIKFGVCLDYAARLGAQKFATGHYARVVGAGTAETAQLHKAADADKDQSYFLHAITREALARTLFPLSDVSKPEVRAEARAAGLPVFDKPDSTGICFIGERPFRAFLQQHLPNKPGPIITAQGRSVGEHVGLAFYTLGQRAGLAIGGQRGADETPWYVARKDAARNELIVVQGHDHSLLQSQRMYASDLHWLVPAPQVTTAVHAKVRYRQADQQAMLEPAADGSVKVHFEAVQRAVTPGQFAVFYAGTRCIGGGTIEHVDPL